MQLIEDEFLFWVFLICFYCLFLGIWFIVWWSCIKDWKERPEFEERELDVTR